MSGEIHESYGGDEVDYAADLYNLYRDASVANDIDSPITKAAKDVFERETGLKVDDPGDAIIDAADMQREENAAAGEARMQKIAENTDLPRIPVGDGIPIEELAAIVDRHFGLSERITEPTESGTPNYSRSGNFGGGTVKMPRTKSSRKPGRHRRNL